MQYFALEQASNPGLLLQGPSEGNPQEGEMQQVGARKGSRRANCWGLKKERSKKSGLRNVLGIWSGGKCTQTHSAASSPWPGPSGPLSFTSEHQTIPRGRWRKSLTYSKVRCASNIISWSNKTLPLHNKTALRTVVRFHTTISIGTSRTK